MESGGGKPPKEFALAEVFVDDCVDGEAEDEGGWCDSGRVGGSAGLHSTAYLDAPQR